MKGIKTFGKIAVFAVEQPKDKLWISENHGTVFYTMINPTKYEVTVKDAKKGDALVFSENFDPNWIARSESIKYQVSSIKYDGTLNSFVLPKDGDYELIIYYEPQKWVERGLVISIGTLVILIGCVIVLRRRKK